MMSTPNKLWFGFGFLLLLLTGAGLFVAWRLVAIERALLTIMAVQEPATAVTYEMSVTVSRIRYAVLDYLSSGDATRRARVVSGYADFDRLRAGYDRIARTQTSRTLGGQIGTAFWGLRALGDTLMELSDRERELSAGLARSHESMDTLIQRNVRPNLEGKGRDSQRKAAAFAILGGELARIDVALGDFLLTGDGRLRTTMAGHEGAFRQVLARCRELPLSDEERAMTADLEQRFSRFVTKAHDNATLEETKREHLERYTALGARVERLVVEGIHSLARIDLLEAQRAALLGIQSSLIAVLLLLVAGILIGSGTALPTGRSIVRTEQALRERMAELAAADRRKDEFLGVLGHELRNPLAPVSNALQLLESHDRDVPPEVRHLHGMVRRQVRTMSRLVDDLLDVSRISEGKITLRREPVDLVALVAEVVEDLTKVLDDHGVEIELSLPDRGLWIDADRTRVAQVVTNLLNNAAKYTPRGGRVMLAVEPREREALIAVSDSGIGIPPEMLSRVFEPFAQLEHLPGQAQGGLGIGLWLVRSLVELHGGVVTAESGGSGKGSTFVVRLPRLEKAPEVPAERPGAVAPGPPATPMRILVVDDNRDSVESMSILLRMWGHEVFTAHDGPSSLAAARACRPDLVFLDIGLPGADGYQVAAQLRTIPESRSALLVALTGLGLDEDRRKAFAAGFDRHITKPVSPEELRELVARRPG